MFKNQCRTCGHNIHGNVMGNGCDVFYCDYNDNDMTPNYCDCSDYVPAGNLEYLEWRHEKNQLQKSL